MADPFMAHVNRLLFGSKVPNVQEARLLVGWTLKHVIDYNTGGVGGDIQIAVLEKPAGKWSARLVDVEEIKQQVADIEDHVSRYWTMPKKAPDLGTGLAADFVSSGTVVEAAVSMPTPDDGSGGAAA